MQPSTTTTHAAVCEHDDGKRGRLGRIAPATTATTPHAARPDCSSASGPQLPSSHAANGQQQTSTTPDHNDQSATSFRHQHGAAVLDRVPPRRSASAVRGHDVAINIYRVPKRNERAQAFGASTRSREPLDALQITRTAKTISLLGFEPLLSSTSRTVRASAGYVMQ